MSGIDPRDFKHTLSRFLSGVTVVSVSDGGEVYGMTASAFLSVSLEPPLVLVSVGKLAHMHGHVVRAGRFAISILASGQEGYSNHFAGRPQADLAVPWLSDNFATPVIADALANIDCDLHSAVDAGDHTLFVGLVKKLRYRDGEPLGYYQGRYRDLV